MISKQKEIFNKLVDERIKKITNLDKKVNLDDLIYRLIYRYKGKTPDENFDTYDNVLNLIDKIKNVEIKLAETKNDQIKFKSNLGKIKKGNNQKYQKIKKTCNTILKCFTKQKTRLLNFMMIIL